MVQERSRTGVTRERRRRRVAGVGHGGQVQQRVGRIGNVGVCKQIRVRANGGEEKVTALWATNSFLARYWRNGTRHQMLLIDGRGDSQGSRRRGL